MRTRKIIEQDQNKKIKFNRPLLKKEDDEVSDLVVWQPTHGTRSRRRPPDSYIKTLERDTGLRENDLRAAMMNRDVWKSITVGESIKRSRNKLVSNTILDIDEMGDMREYVQELTPTILY